MAKQVDWNGSVSFEQYVVGIFERQGHLTNSPEFLSAMRWKGRDHLAAIWRKYKNGHIKRPDPSNEVTHPTQVTESRTTRETKEAPKARSFVERSCPDDDF